MKTTNKIILALGIMLGAVSMESKASVLTVSNSTIAAVQYTSVQTAIAAAVDGDTLYIHGSAFTYGNIVIDKKLTLIGAGYKVTGTQNNVSTSFNDIQFTGAPSGSSFTGIGVGSFNFSNSTAAGNIHINRCYIGHLSKLR